MASDLLTTVRRELDARLRELRPLLTEYERLTAVAEALGGMNHGAARSPSVSKATPSDSPPTRRRRGRRWVPAAAGARPPRLRPEPSLAAHASGPREARLARRSSPPSSRTLIPQASW